MVLFVLVDLLRPAMQGSGSWFVLLVFIVLVDLLWPIVRLSGSTVGAAGALCAFGLGERNESLSESHLNCDFCVL